MGTTNAFATYILENLNIWMLPSHRAPLNSLSVTLRTSLQVYQQPTVRLSRFHPLPLVPPTISQAAPSPTIYTPIMAQTAAPIQDVVASTSDCIPQEPSMPSIAPSLTYSDESDDQDELVQAPEERTRQRRASTRLIAQSARDIQRITGETTAEFVQNTKAAQAYVGSNHIIGWGVWRGHYHRDPDE